MDYRIPRRRGVSLLELLVVVSIMGVVAIVAVARFGPTVFGDFGSQSDARRLSLDVLQAQRRAISTGDNHFLRFASVAGQITGYTLYRRTDSGPVQLDNFRAFSAQVQVTASDTEMEFNFEGQALAAYRVRLAGAHRSWEVTIVPASGTARVVEL